MKFIGQLLTAVVFSPRNLATTRPPPITGKPGIPNPKAPQTHSCVASYVDEGADVLQVVLVHGRVGRRQVQKVVVASLGALELGLLRPAVPLCSHTHTEEMMKIREQRYGEPLLTHTRRKNRKPL